MKSMEFMECLPGWKSIIQPLWDRAQKEGVEVLQIKEKFGGLRFYVGPASDEFHNAINDAESKSFTVCELCGADGKRRDDLPWIKTLCDQHHEEWKQRGGRP